MFFMRKISISVVYLIFFSYQAIGSGMLDIDDHQKDQKINSKHLPKFITEIFKTRAEYIKEKKDFKYEDEGKFGDGKFIFNYKNIEIISYDVPPTDGVFAFAKKFKDFLNESYKFFTDPSFFSIKNGKVNIEIETNNPVHLTVFYVNAASELSRNYMEICGMRSSLANTAILPAGKIVLKSVIAIMEDTLGDLTKIIHAIRPHIIGKNTLPQLKERFKEAEEKLKLMALYENTYQWIKISSEPELQSILKSLIDKPLLDSITIDLEPEKVTLVPKLEGEQADSQKKPLSAAPIIQTPKTQSLIPPSQPSMPKGKKEKQHLKEEHSEEDARQKSRPSEGWMHLQGLNGFFEDDPVERISKKLKKETSLKSSNGKDENPINNPNSNSNSNSESNKIPSHHFKTLYDVLYSKNLGALDVDATLKMLSYFDILEPTTNNHYLLKPSQTIGMWLKGERTLIEIVAEDETETSGITTLAVKHKKDGKRYFSLRSMSSIRKALITAKFDQLLK